ncbi:response regulator transcription factor [Clostridium intestinale]|uniref:response regulator transcription factor n=1 Tax=Clostridium intestinale TaxID=36845 RepID=UPI002DD67038|nr:response regulator transcription factor [Clostridium intestinale]WRY49551.1 response regulator transcription factor [Clostridium intestinale]
MHGRILICDDEKEIVDFIEDALIDEGYEVITAYDGDMAVAMINKQPDLILLDIMMPGKDGYEVCNKIRDKVNCPIIFLSAKQDEMDKLKALALGGDDYITKPFSIRELKARVSAHIRRDRRTYQGERRNIIYFGNLSIDISSRELYYDNEKTEVRFTKKEFDIIELLCLHPMQVFSKEKIYEKIWGYDAEGDSSSVAEHVKNIRNKLLVINENLDYISTVWGVGYKWEKNK